MWVGWKGRLGMLRGSCVCAKGMGWTRWVLLDTETVSGHAGVS